MDTTQRMLQQLAEIVSSEDELAGQLAKTRRDKQELMAVNMAELVGMGLIQIKLNTSKLRQAVS